MRDTKNKEVVIGNNKDVISFKNHLKKNKEDVIFEENP
jgi:hypothetical protein